MVLAHLARIRVWRCVDVALQLMVGGRKVEV